MGADFIFTTAALPIKDGKVQKPRWPRAISRKHVRMAREAEIFYEDSTDSAIKSMLLDELKFFKEAIKNDSRELGAFRFKGNMIYLTGGMSWGDPPTELFDTINNLWQAGILEDAGFI